MNARLRSRSSIKSTSAPVIENVMVVGGLRSSCIFCRFLIALLSAHAAAMSSVSSTPWPASSPASAAAGTSRVFGALAHVIALVAVELPCADDALARSRQRDRFSRLGRRHRSRWRRAERSHRRLCPGDVAKPQQACKTRHCRQQNRSSDFHWFPRMATHSQFSFPPERQIVPLGLAASRLSEYLRKLRYSRKKRERAQFAELPSACAVTLPVSPENRQERH